MLLTGARVVTPGGVREPAWVRVVDGVVADIGDGASPPPSSDASGFSAAPPEPTVALAGGWLVPGFVDIHNHGGGGASVVGADPTAVATAAAAHLAHGTTTMVASLVSAHPQPLLRDTAALADLVEDGVVHGIHLEGPWIAPAYQGAHDPATLRDPDPTEVERVLQAGRGSVVMVTLAPEWEHGIEATRVVVDHGALAAVGHTDATYARTRAAIDAGATVSTHLFNAQRPLHHREPGPMAAMLEDERVSVEVIVDEVHVHPAMVALARRATPRVVLITDAMAAAGGADGRYLLGDLAVDVVDGVARLAEGGAIAGSTLTLDVAVRNAVLHCGFTVSQAVTAVSTRPARLLGLTDRGAIAAGLRADLCHLDDDLRLRAVWRAGDAVPVAASAAPREPTDSAPN
jgi:N-acetylglucosamine-6-phosphate deacetylase